MSTNYLRRKTITTATKVKWGIKGDAIGSCSCDWGCPCNFDAPPTQGWCHGGYVFHINDGHVGDTKLEGLTVGFFGSTPAAMHLGNMTAYLLVDDKAAPDQRVALGRVFAGELGGPFAIFASLIVKLIGPEFAPVEWKFDGPNSYARFGDRVQVGLKMSENPVTGEKSGFTLKMTNGLLTNEAELMASSVFRVNHPELSYDHSGQYGETFRFNYSGEG